MVGLEAYGKQVKAEDTKLLAGRDPASPDKPFLDFRQWPLAGVQALDRYTLRIRPNGKYPQWSFWLAMPFTAPVPWDAEGFYARPGMSRNGLSLDPCPCPGEGVSLASRFRQGYLDVPEIEQPDFGVVFSVEAEDSDARAREYKDKGFKLRKVVDISSGYLGFNWLDPVVGQGDTPEQQLSNLKLRHALAIAIDWEERSRIFPTAAGKTAMTG